MGERWLKAEATAAYTNIRIDYLKRYVKAGKLPPHPTTLGQDRRVGIGRLWTPYSSAAKLNPLIT